MDIGPMQINSSNLAEVKSRFPAITWRELAYDACASLGWDMVAAPENY
jgi:hypothetical protein